MARIEPLDLNTIDLKTQLVFKHHTEQYQARITNMKATLGHSLLSFDVYMKWYSLYDEIKIILGERVAFLYAYSISLSSDCPLCTTFFRKIIVDNGMNPAALLISDEEQELLNFGAAIASGKGRISNDIFDPVSVRYSKEEIVVLVAFAGQMIATNIFNNVFETDIDEYLQDYLK